MIFTFGKYEGYEVNDVINLDRKYCVWIAERIAKKDKHKELYSEIMKKLPKVESQPEKPDMMMFGKYEGIKIKDFIFNDKSYCKWLLKTYSFKDEYPKTFDYLKKYYDVVYENPALKTRFFYLLTFIDRDYLKVGITKNFIVKRVYSYTHTMNDYQNDLIDYKSSFVYMTNDIDIERKVLKNFKELRVNVRTDKIRTSVDDIDSFIIQQGKSNLDFFYTKKCLYDFMPFDNGREFKRSLRIKINEFVNFKEVYEEHLTRLNLKHKYNPKFIDIRQNRN